MWVTRQTVTMWAPRLAAVLLFLAGSVVGVAAPAHAATNVVSGQASCQAAFPGALWTESSFCTLPAGTSTIAGPDTLEIADPVAIVVGDSATLAVDGELVVQLGGRLLVSGGDLSVRGTLTNRGFWDVRSTSDVTVAVGAHAITTNQLQLLESAVMTNAGTLDNTGRIGVSATLVNDGTLDTTGGTLLVDCQRGEFVNNGSLLGTVDEDICFVGTGTWENPSNWTTGVVPSNTDVIDIRGRATITSTVVRSAFTRVSGQLAVGADGVLTVSTDGVIETATPNPSFFPRLRFDGTVNNHGTISNNGSATVDGLLRNYGRFTRTSANTSLTIGGGVRNSSAGLIEGGIDVLAGGELTNVGDVLLTKSLNTNAGLIDNSPVASFTLHNSLTNLSAGQLRNRGELRLEHDLTFPPVLDNRPGAVLLNDEDAIIAVDTASSLTSNGNVENRGHVANSGSVDNAGSWCGPGSVGPDAVTGTAPVASCLPKIDLGPDRSVGEGALLTLTDGFHDPGVPTGFTATFDWDDGTSSAGSFSQLTLVSQRVTGSHTYGDDGHHDVEAVICDGGGCATDVVRISVHNLPPQVMVEAVAPTAEGSPTTIEFTASDPGADDVLHVPAGGTSCGVGGTLVAGSMSFDGAVGSFSCIFADGPSVETVGVTVADDDGGETTATRTVSVVNVPPTITSVDVSGDPVAVGAQLDARAEFTDPGADTFTAHFEWGDGNATAGAVTGTSAEGDHDYASAGLYLVTATVTDDDGGSDTRSADEHVVVYDPDSLLALNATFASPAGAFVGEPDRTASLQVTGRSRYPNGDVPPTGRLTVRERGDVLLDATAFDWLVVTSQTSFAMGTADWMGDAGATFLLSVEPGHTDDGRIRLQVWDTGGRRVYDNEPGVASFADPTTPITRGAAAGTAHRGVTACSMSRQPSSISRSRGSFVSVLR